MNCENHGSEDMRSTVKERPYPSYDCSKEAQQRLAKRVGVHGHIAYTLKIPEPNWEQQQRGAVAGSEDGCAWTHCVHDNDRKHGLEDICEEQ
eukprot:1160293-Pelagomonas_calceolata.AAC.6